MAENTNSEDGEVVQWVKTPADCKSTQTHSSVEMDGRRSGQSPEAPGSESRKYVAESNEETVSKQDGRREPKPEIVL